MSTSATLTDASTPVRKHRVWSKAQITQTLEHIELESDLVVFRLTYDVVMDEQVPPSLAACYGTQHQEGFARPAAIERFVTCKARSIETVDVKLAQPNWLANTRRLGYMPAYEALGNTADAWQHNVFEAFRTGQANIDDLVTENFSAHMLFDRHGEVLPVALHFGYISGGMHDAAFDLDRALPLLMVNEQVHARGGRDRSSALRIEPIPYYNRDCERSAQIDFVFSPTVEQMRALWKKAKAMRRQFPSTALHDAVHALDLLGLRAGGAYRNNQESR